MKSPKKRTQYGQRMYDKYSSFKYMVKDCLSFCARNHLKSELKRGNVPKHIMDRILNESRDAHALVRKEYMERKES